MYGEHLDVYVIPSPVGVLVLDARIREMDLVIEVRQVTIVGTHDVSRCLGVR